MTTKDNLTEVRYYTPADIYFYTTDNRPIADLAERDDALADELDRRSLAVDITGGVSPVTNRIPTGWSVARTGAGVYELTHTLGNTNFVVTGCIYGATPGIVRIVNQTSTIITIGTTNTSGVATDFRFQCVVVGY